MSYKETSDFCSYCNRRTVFRKQKPNDVLHVILTIFSCFLWAIVWIADSFIKGAAPYCCSICGTPHSSRPKTLPQTEIQEPNRSLPESSVSAPRMCRFCRSNNAHESVYCHKCGNMLTPAMPALSVERTNYNQSDPSQSSTSLAANLGILAAFFWLSLIGKNGKVAFVIVFVISVMGVLLIVSPFIPENKPVRSQLHIIKSDSPLPQPSATLLPAPALTSKEHLAKAREILKKGQHVSREELAEVRNLIEGIPDTAKQEKKDALSLLKQVNILQVKLDSEAERASDKEFCKKPDLQCALIIKPVLRQMLHDPDSLDDFDVIGCSSEADAPGMIKVTVSYRARNGFGALRKNTQSFVLMRSSSAQFGYSVIPVKD